MNENKKRNIVLAIVTVCVMILSGFGFYQSNKDKITQEIVNSAINEIKDYIENQSTTEIPELSEIDEQTVEVQETEAEGFEEQGRIAYNGSDKTPKVSVGDYAGLTYYSQVDSRWKNKMYSITGDSTQTIGSSGCGPTSAAMVVSSIKGTITPPEMSDLYVQNGYRTVDNGTYWSAFRWTADVFDIEYQETSKIDNMVNLVRNNNYVIASCANGLFTYGGHFIVIIGVEGNNLKIYDPYLYGGKFDTATRRGKVEVKGNTVYCSVENFRNYANYRNFFCFKNDRTDTKENNTNVTVDSNITSNITNVNYKVKVTANNGLNIRSGASINYSKVGGYSKNTIVTILAESNGWGKTNIGWICLNYTNKIVQNNANNYGTGNYRVTASVLNVRSGPGKNYQVKTYKQLTSNARVQNKKLGNYYANGYKKGVVCTITKINGNWGLTNSGWVCLDYCKKI